MPVAAASTAFAVGAKDSSSQRTQFNQFIQWMLLGANLGSPTVQVIDIIGDPNLISVTRGVGENKNVITIRKSRSPIFVAVARSGAQRVMTSSDGITWSLHNAASARSWTAVCYSQTLNLYCAVASDGIGDGVMTSPDGINWTSRTPAGNWDWESVCWNGYVFIAGAQSGIGANRIMTSPDGINWTMRVAAFGANWGSLASNGTVDVSVAASSVPLNVQYSQDHGVTWTNATNPDSSSNVSFKGVAWSGINFIAIENSSSVNTQVLTSPDGVIWTARVALGTAHSWGCIAMGSVNGVTRAVAIAVSVLGGLQVMTSDDHGLTWSGFASSIANTWRGVAWNGSIFAAVADVGLNTRVMTSPDGHAWTTQVNPADNIWTSICSNQALF